MIEVTAIVKANVTVVYKVNDESEIKTVKDFNADFDKAMRGDGPFTFDDIEAIKVKNFIDEKPVF